MQTAAGYPVKKKIFIAGSTGSIGVSALSIIDKLNAAGHRFSVEGLAAGSNYRRLRQQILKYMPKAVYIGDSDLYTRLKKEFVKISFFSSGDFDGAINKSAPEIVLNGVSGSAGIFPTLAAVKRGVILALANKESLVMAGTVVLKEAAKSGTKIIPVDSEHSAVFQILRGIKNCAVEKIILTASGGPFLHRPNLNPTAAQALSHPTWKMGKKISIDSATMMNKGLEIIEAHYLFNLPYKKIEAIIHPQSLIHSMVETCDGEIYAQIGHNDMRFPIQNAFTYPDICYSPLKRLKLWELKELTFIKPDMKKYPLFQLALTCAEKGGSAPVVLNAANEAAVNLFLAGKIQFCDIYRIVYRALSRHTRKIRADIHEIIELDSEIKRKIFTEENHD